MEESGRFVRRMLQKISTRSTKTATLSDPSAAGVISNSETVYPVLQRVVGSRRLAKAEIALGAFIMLLEIIEIAADWRRKDVMTWAAAGIWNGVIYMMAGALVMYATRPPTVDVKRKWLFIACIVTGFISSFLAMAMFVFCIMTLIVGMDMGNVSNCQNLGAERYDCMAHFYMEPGLSAARIGSLFAYLVLFFLFTITATIASYNIFLPDYRDASDPAVADHLIHGQVERLSTRRLPNTVRKFNRFTRRFGARVVGTLERRT